MHADNAVRVYLRLCTYFSVFPPRSVTLFVPFFLVVTIHRALE